MIFILWVVHNGLIFAQINETEIEYQERKFVEKLAIYPFDEDSLKGFDEARISKEIESETKDPLEQKFFNVFKEKRIYINHKYNLHHELEDLGYDVSYLNNKFDNNSVLSVACNNEDFETGDFTGWIVNTGVVSDACSGAGCCGSGFGLATVMTTPFSDPYVGAIPASPFGGTRVAKLNDVAVGARAVRIRKNINVTPNNALFQFAYIAVLNVPSNSHPCCAVPKIKIRIIDPSGNILGCPQVEISVPQGGCPPLPAGWVNAGSVVYNPTWQIGSIDLTSFLGQNISIIVDVYDCTWTGHFGYAYFDAICKPITIDVNGIQFPAGNNNINVTACGASTATLTAPAGLAPYNWNGPPSSGITNNPNQTITTTVAGVYTLVMSPPGICAPIVKTMTLNFSPPITLSVNSSSTTICSGQSATLSANPSMSGGTFTWIPTGSNSSSVIVSPPSSQVYTVNYTAPNSCPASATFTLNVNPTPTIALSSGTLCSGNSIIITSTVNPSSGLSYTWLPGGNNSPNITDTPPITTTYTLLVQTSAGCFNTTATTITVFPTPTITVSNQTICNQSSTILNPTISPSGGNYTWMPTGQTSSSIAVSPTTNTSYTVNYLSLDGCFQSAVINVNVNPSPTVSISNYTYCSSPNNFIILSASSVNPPGGTYIWWPSGTINSTIAVSPSVTTTYTLDYIDPNNGCKTSATSTVVVRPGFLILNFNPDNWYKCEGNASFTLTPNILTSTGSYSIAWNFGAAGNPSISFSNPGFTQYNTPGTYPITLIGTNLLSNCKDSITKFVHVEPLPDLDFIYNTKSCQSDSIYFTNLSWVGGLSQITGWLWNFGDGNFSTQQHPAHHYTNNGVYSVTLSAVTDYGCTSSITKTINVSPNSAAGIVISSQTVCASSANGTLQLSGNVGQVLQWEYSDNYGVNWYVINNTSIVQPFSNIQSTRWYRALIKSDDCPAMYTTPFATITVDMPSKAGEILTNSTVVCIEGNTLSLTTNNYIGTIEYWLLSQDGINWDTIPGSYGQNPLQITNLNDTSYFQVLVKNGVCPVDSSNKITVYVQKFNATTPLSYTNTISLGDSIQLVAEGGTQFNWQPPYNINNPFIFNPIVWPQKDTNYAVIVTNQYGCKDTLSFRIIVNKDFQLIIANTITPNNDGKNDIWWIGNIENYNENEVFIFNRYGQMIYQAKNYDNKKIYWDGTYQGQKVPDGTYYYVLKFNNAETIFKGHINVISSH
ncbi:MAG: hypothetical protein KatS3mg027_1475 [Bacteroidia bacterium]|nr:MAG: hypothetical protein KatS3mg027_1475 [Bacteroidia bacterium]